MQRLMFLFVLYASFDGADAVWCFIALSINEVAATCVDHHVISLEHHDDANCKTASETVPHHYFLYWSAADGMRSVAETALAVW